MLVVVGFYVVDSEIGLFVVRSSVGCISDANEGSF